MVSPRLLLLVYSSEEILEIWQDAEVDEKEGTLHAFVTFPVGASVAISPPLLLDPSGSYQAHIESPRALAAEDCEVHALCSQGIGAAKLRKMLPFWAHR